MFAHQRHVAQRQNVAAFHLEDPVHARQAEVIVAQGFGRRVHRSNVGKQRGVEHRTICRDPDALEVADIGGDARLGHREYAAWRVDQRLVRGVRVDVVLGRAAGPA